MRSAPSPSTGRSNSRPHTRVAQALATVRAAPGITVATPVSYATTPGLRRTPAAPCARPVPARSSVCRRATRPPSPGRSARSSARRRRAARAADRGEPRRRRRGRPSRSSAPGSRPCAITRRRRGRPAGRRSLFQAIGAPPVRHRPLRPTTSSCSRPRDGRRCSRTRRRGRRRPRSTSSSRATCRPIRERRSRRSSVARRTSRPRSPGRGSSATTWRLSSTARGSDAIYAQLLFLFLGLPGVVLAAAARGGRGGHGPRTAPRRAGPAAHARRRAARDRASRRRRGARSSGRSEPSSVSPPRPAPGRICFGTARFGATPGQAVAWTVMSIVFGLGLAVRDRSSCRRWRDVRALTVRGRSSARPARPGGRCGRGCTSTSRCLGGRRPASTGRRCAAATRWSSRPKGCRRSRSALHVARAGAVLDRRRARDRVDRLGDAALAARSLIAGAPRARSPTACPASWPPRCRASAGRCSRGWC